MLIWQPQNAGYLISENLSFKLFPGKDGSTLPTDCLQQSIPQFPLSTILYSPRSAYIFLFQPPKIFSIMKLRTN